MVKPENEFFDERSEFYKSWESWLETKERHQRGGRSGEDRGAYLPDPVEVSVRIGILFELRRLEFNERFICSVMQFDTPTIEVVRAMVERYGPAETYRRCQPFLADTEYDKECDREDE